MRNELTIRAGKGSAMDELTEKQRKFVIAFLESGGKNAANAVLIAGYKCTHPNSSDGIGYELLRNEKVIRALREEADRRLRANAVLGASVLVEIAQDSLHKDRLKAALALMDRGGLQFIQRVEHHHTVEDKRSERELVQSIVDMAGRMNMDPKAILGFDPKEVLDGQYTEVPPTDEINFLDDALYEDEEDE